MFFLVPRHHPHLSPGLLESTLLYPIRNTKQMINLQACLQKHWRIRKQLEQKPIQHKKSSWHHQVQRAVHAAGPNKSRILEPLLSKSYLSCLSAQLPLVLIIYNIGMWVNGRTIVIVRVWVPTLPTKDTKPSPCSKTLYAGIKISNQRVPKKKKSTQEGEKVGRLEERVRTSSRSQKFRHRRRTNTWVNKQKTKTKTSTTTIQLSFPSFHIQASPLEKLWKQNKENSLKYIRPLPKNATVLAKKQETNIKAKME